ncbi:MAG: hypothetical protein H7296_10695 [Bacteroidia bacterium]|nr:hypothetical protein [Bacteroidia bacterium]
MLKRFTVFFTLTVLLFVLSLACKKASQSLTSTINDTKWNRMLDTVPVSVTFSSDNSYTIKLYGITGESGTYTNSSTSLTLHSTFGVCTNSPGTYNYLIIGSKITFVPVQDSCNSRKIEVSGDWTK